MLRGFSRGLRIKLSTDPENYKMLDLRSTHSIVLNYYYCQHNLYHMNYLQNYIKFWIALYFDTSSNKAIL